MLKAQDLMTRDVVTVPPDLPIKELSKLFLDKKKNGFPVVDAAGKLIGMVTEKDLIDQNKQLHLPTVIALFDAVIYLESEKKFEQDLLRMTGTVVKDIHTPNPRTVAPETSLPEIAAIMAEHDIHTLPVMENETLVGVIGKIDVIRGLAES